jgi:Na+/H+ antiporter NhaC
MGSPFSIAAAREVKLMLTQIARWPLRKPLAVFAALLVGGSVLFCLATGRDVPPNMAILLQWFGGITLAAYYTSSSYEATKKAKE